MNYSLDLKAATDRMYKKKIRIKNLKSETEGLEKDVKRDNLACRDVSNAMEALEVTIENYDKNEMKDRQLEVQRIRFEAYEQ